MGGNYRDSQAILEKAEKFQGTFGQVNLWNTAMGRSFVKELVRDCKNSSYGNVVAWPDFRYMLRGDVQVIEPPACKSTGMKDSILLLIYYDIPTVFNLRQRSDKMSHSK